VKIIISIFIIIWCQNFYSQNSIGVELSRTNYQFDTGNPSDVSTGSSSIRSLFILRKDSVFSNSMFFGEFITGPDFRSNRYGKTVSWDHFLSFGIQSNNKLYFNLSLRLGISHPITKGDYYYWPFREENTDPQVKNLVFTGQTLLSVGYKFCERASLETGINVIKDLSSRYNISVLYRFPSFHWNYKVFQSGAYIPIRLVYKL